MIARHLGGVWTWNTRTYPKDSLLSLLCSVRAVMSTWFFFTSSVSTTMAKNATITITRIGLVGEPKRQEFFLPSAIFEEAGSTELHEIKVNG